MIIWGRCSAYALLLMIACLSPGRAETLPETVTISAAESSAVHEVATAVLRQLYQRVGIGLTIRYVPSKRSLSEADAGRTDGEAARIAGTEGKYPNLVPVPVPVTTVRGTAFTISVDANISTWSDLRPYTVGIKRGIRFSEIGTRGLDRVFANSARQLFRLLVDGYVDVAVISDIDGKQLVAFEFAGHGIREAGTPLHETPLYHYLHKHNAALIGLLAENLAVMRDEGELEQIRSRVMVELIEAY